MDLRGAGRGRRAQVVAAAVASSPRNSLVEACPEVPDRGYRIGGHTADARIHAWARTLPDLLEEAAAALSALTVEIDETARPAAWTDVEVTGHDVDHLAFAWLNELIGITEVEHRAVAVARVGQLQTADGDQTTVGDQPMGADQAAGTSSLHARIGLVDYEPHRVTALRQAKAVTLHGLRVVEHHGGWTIDAVVDM